MLLIDFKLTLINQIYALETETLVKAQQSSSFSSNFARSIELLVAKIDTKEATNSSGTRQRFQMQSPILVAHSWTRNEDNNSIIGFMATTSENKTTRSTVLSINATNDDMEQSDVVALLPFQNSASSTQQTGRSQEEKVTFITYPDTRLIDASAASGEFSSAVFMSDLSDGWSQSEELFTGNGAMVQVHLSPPPSPVMAKPVTLYFRPKYPTTPEKRHLLRCVFWNEKMNAGKGGWSVDGCWHEGTINGMEGCQCNHLSTFTLLVSRSEKYLQSTVHGAILNVITLIGSVLSIAGLSLILLTFVLFPTWRKPMGHKILVQLSLALVVLLITFIIAVETNVENINACRTAAVFLHYSLIATFCWMTVEAYYQYQRLVKIFDTYIPNFMLKASLLAWSLPLIPISAVLIYDVDSYTGDEGYCWLRPNPFYFSALLPIAMLLLVNIFVFTLVFRSIAATGKGIRTNQSERKQAKEKLIACLFNFVLLGLSWTFGFFAIGPTNSILFSYLFCSTTTLQGFFLFVLCVVRDPSTHRLWMKLFRLDKCSSTSQSDPKSVATSEGYITSISTVEKVSTPTVASKFSFASTTKIKPHVKPAKLEHQEVKRAAKPYSH